MKFISKLSAGAVEYVGKFLTAKAGDDAPNSGSWEYLVNRARSGDESLNFNEIAISNKYKIESSELLITSIKLNHENVVISGELKGAKIGDLKINVIRLKEVHVKKPWLELLKAIDKFRIVCYCKIDNAALLNYSLNDNSLSVDLLEGDIKKITLKGLMRKTTQGLEVKKNSSQKCIVIKTDINSNIPEIIDDRSFKQGDIGVIISNGSPLVSPANPHPANTSS